MRSLLFLLLILHAVPLSSADLHDPRSRIDPLYLLACLREQRNLPADEPHLRRAAIACAYLCLNRTIQESASCGPWFRQLQALAKRQRAALGRPPADFAEAEPGLWADWFSGRGNQVAAELERFAGDDAALGLRSLVRRDITWWPAKAAPTPLAEAAVLFVARDHDLWWTIRDAAKAARHAPPYALGVDWEDYDDTMYYSFANPGLIRLRREWLGLLAASLADPLLDEAPARQALVDMVTALGFAPGAAESRRDLAGAILDRFKSPPSKMPPALLIAGFKAWALLAQGPRAGEDPNPRFLAGPGDVADHLRDRWCLEVDLHPLRSTSSPEVGKEEAAIGPEDAFFPFIQFTRVKPVAASSLAGLRAGSIPPVAIARQLCPRGSNRWPHPPFTPRVAQEMIVAAGDRFRSGLICPFGLTVIARELRTEFETGDLQPGLEAWLAEDRYEVAGRRQAEWLRGDRPMFRLADRQPAAAWIDPCIAHATWEAKDLDLLAWPREGRKEWFAVEWTGWIELPGGPVGLRLNSDDGGWFTAAGMAVDGSRNRSMSQSRSCVLDRPAGWYPLRVQFFNGIGGGGCRLSWSPGATGSWSTVPAAALAHGDPRQAGLNAQGWFLADEGDLGRSITGTQVGPLVRTAAAELPWNTAAQREVLLAALETGDATAARPAIALLACQSREIRDLQAIALARLGDPAVSDAEALAALSAWCDRAFEPDRPKYWSGDNRWNNSWMGTMEGKSRILEDALHAGCSRRHLQRACAAMLQEGFGDDEAKALLIGDLLLEAGDLAGATERYEEHLKKSDLRSRVDAAINQRRLLLWWLWNRAQQRLAAPPAWLQEKVANSLRQTDNAPCIRWLVLGGSEAQARQEAASTPRPDLPDFYLAFLQLTTGRQAEARAGFAAYAVAHPGTGEAVIAGELARWMSLLPEEAAKLPAAPPLVEGIAVEPPKPVPLPIRRPPPKPAPKTDPEPAPEPAGAIDF